jgi:hypothetical protein
MNPIPDNELELVAEVVRKSIAFRRMAPERFEAGLDEFMETLKDLGARWRDVLHDEEIRGLLENFDISPGRRLIEDWRHSLEDLESGGMDISATEMLAALTYLVTIFPSEDWKWEVTFEALRETFAMGRPGGG